MKEKHWFLVAESSQALVYEKFLHDDRSPGASFIDKFENPEARLKAQDIMSDSMGHVDSGENSYAWSSDPVEQEVIKFAKDVSGFLDKARQEDRFNALTVIAAPTMLGKLRAEFSSPLKDVVGKRSASLLLRF